MPEPTFIRDDIRDGIRDDIRDGAHLATRECEELDVWSAGVGWEVNYHQTGKGKFDAWFNLSLGHDLKVVDQYCNRETVGVGVPPTGHIALLIPHNDGSRGIFAGKTLVKNEVVLMGPGVEGVYTTPPNLRMMTLHLPLSRLRRAFLSLAGEELDPLIRNPRLITLPPAIIKQNLRFGRQIIEIAPGISAAAPSVVWQQEIEEHFVNSIAEVLARPDGTEPGLLARRSRVKYVKSARDYIESHLNEPLGLETLAQLTEVSPRTLEYAFREVLDTTPVRYVKLRRLQAARRRLLESDDHTQTVTQVALELGFKHFSHFSQDYHGLFGELPSATLSAR